MGAPVHDLTSPKGDPFALVGTFVAKDTDEDRQLIFGWANVAVRKDGSEVVDADGESTDIEILETAAYLFVLKFREANDLHDAEVHGQLVESMGYTPEKLEALGLAKDAVPLGWWVGFHLDDQADFEKVKKGERRMFSIEGSAIREKVSSAAA